MNKVTLIAAYRMLNLSHGQSASPVNGIRIRQQRNYWWNLRAEIIQSTFSEHNAVTQKISIEILNSKQPKLKLEMYLHMKVVNTQERLSRLWSPFSSSVFTNMYTHKLWIEP